jgi:hypothetical protein
MLAVSEELQAREQVGRALTVGRDHVDRPTVRNLHVVAARRRAPSG